MPIPKWDGGEKLALFYAVTSCYSAVRDENPVFLHLFLWRDRLRDAHAAFLLVDRTRPIRFDRRGLPAYLAMLLGILLAAAFVIFGGYRFTAPFLALPPLWCGALWISGPLSRRINLPRLGNCCEALALIYAQGIAICLALPMLAAVSGPMADNVLIRLDHAIGLDWQTFVMSVRDRAAILATLRVAYTSFVWQPALIIIALFVARQDDRAWRLVNASAIALLATIALFALFPAVGGFIHYGITPSAYHLDAKTPWSFGPAILQMKAGTKLITPSLMVGYVSFPSYHAAAALLLTLAAWPIRWLRWPILALNIGVIVAAPIYGAHYFIDLIAGLAIAAAAFAVACIGMPEFLAFSKPRFMSRFANVS